MRASLALLGLLTTGTAPTLARAEIPAAPLYDHPAIGRAYFFPPARGKLLRSADAGPVALKGAGGKLIEGYHLRPFKGATTLLYCYGNGSSIAGELPRWSAIARQLGVNLMMVDYPGYGASEGSPSFSGCSQAARAALDYLLAQPEKEVPRVVIAGRSAGSIFALEAAACRAGSPRIKGLILESGVADLQQRIEVRRLPLAALGIDGDRLRRELKRDYDHGAKLRKANVPVLVLHTKNDSVVPAWHGAKLASWAGKRLSRQVVFERGDHNTIFPVNERAYLDALGEFLKGSAGR